MSADRIEIECRDGYVIIDGCEYFDHGDFRTDMIDALRQQARDIDQLRADLAAAVAERDEWKGCAMSNLDERDTLRARLAAIDGAPTVACVNSLSQTAPNYLIAELLPPQDRPAIGAELIARPAKD